MLFDLKWTALYDRTLLALSTTYSCFFKQKKQISSFLDPLGIVRSAV